MANPSPARDPDRVFFSLDVELAAVDAGQFDNHYQVLAPLEDVDQRIGSSAGRGIPEPVAKKAGSLEPAETRRGLRRDPHKAEPVLPLIEYRARLVALGAPDEEQQQAIFVLGLDAHPDRSAWER